MRFRPTELPDVILVEPDVHRDPRGFFLETFHARKYAEGGIPDPAVEARVLGSSDLPLGQAVRARLARADVAARSVEFELA